MGLTLLMPLLCLKTDALRRLCAFFVKLALLPGLRFVLGGLNCPDSILRDSFERSCDADGEILETSCDVGRSLGSAQDTKILC